MRQLRRYVNISTKSEKKRGVIYRRVSTDDQKDNGYSLQRQERELREKMLRDGVEEIRQPIEDVESGRDFNRQGLKLLLQLAHGGLIDYVYVYDLDRLGRDVIETPYLMHKLKKLNVVVRDIKEEYNFDDPIQYVYVTIKCYRSHAESIRIGDRTQGGKIEKFKEGKWVGPPPFGCRINSDGFLEIIPEMKDVIRDLFQIVAGCHNYKRAVELINEKHSKIVGLITISKLRNIIKNGVYIGLPKYGSTERVTPSLNIVSEDLWGRIQRFRSNTSKRNKPKLRRKPYTIIDDLAREYGLDYCLCVLKEFKPVCQCGQLMVGNGNKTVMGLSVPKFLCPNGHEKTIPSGEQLEHFMKKHISCPTCRSVDNYNRIVSLDGSVLYECKCCSTIFQFTQKELSGKDKALSNGTTIHENSNWNKNRDSIEITSKENLNQPLERSDTKVKKAVEVAIQAGYQLSTDAFELLLERAKVIDPVKAIEDAIHRFQKAGLKSFFIEKNDLVHERSMN